MVPSDATTRKVAKKINFADAGLETFKNKDHRTNEPIAESVGHNAIVLSLIVEFNSLWYQLAS